MVKESKNRFQVFVPLSPGRPPKMARNMKICALVDAGNLKLADIGRLEGLTRHRVSQIVAKYWSIYVGKKKALSEKQD